MRVTLLACMSVASFALPLSAIASRTDAPISMTGVADSGDTVELRFDSLPSTSATLQIKGDRTGKPKTFPCSYQLEPVQKGALESPVVKITFNDRQTMTIACDPLSDTCHADSYPTVAGTSFSILWRITRAPAQPAQSAQAKTPAAR